MVGRSAAANKHDNPEFPHNFTMMQAFEWYTPGGGTHYKWLSEQAARFADIGITAVWMPPPTKGASQESTGYDVYDLYDLGEFKREGHESERTKYGTRKELEECYKALKQNGIAIYIDAVLNHKGGADDKELFMGQMVDQNKRTEDIGEPYDIEGWTKFEFPQRNGKYSDFKWNFTHFTGVDYDAKGEKNGIWRIVGDDKYWAKEVDKENANYDFLMCADVDHSHPDVKKDMLNWGSWLIRNFPISGFRFDAVKHISRSFICDFVRHVREEARKVRKEQGKEPLNEEEGPVMFGVGEFWKDSVDSCMKYLGEFGDEQFSLFDAPLHYNFKEAGDAGKNYDLRKIFDGTIVQSRPLDAVTLCSNHDTQKGQALESPVPPAFLPLAHALILLRLDGYPCVFLGDLDGTHKDGDKPAEEPVAALDRFLRSRKLFAYGEQRDYWDNANCVGWVRMGEVPEESGTGHDGCAVVICNGDQEGTKWMEVGKDKAGKKYIDILGWTQGEVEINKDGWGEFRCPAMSAGVWILEDAKGREEFK